MRHGQICCRQARQAAVHIPDRRFKLRVGDCHLGHIQPRRLVQGILLSEAYKPLLYKLRSYRRFAGAAAVGGHRRRAEQGIRSCVLLKGRHALAHAAHGQADKQDMHRPADRIRRRGSGIHKKKESVVRARPGDARHYYIDRHRLEHDEHG